MKLQVGLPAVLALLLWSCSGCSWAASGFDREVSFEVNEWEEIQNGYLSVDSDPPGATVYMDAAWTGSIDMRVGFKRKSTSFKWNTKEWAAIGTTPVIDVELPIRGSGIDSQGIGTHADAQFAMRRLSLRFEKEGYETLEMSNVLIRKDRQKKPYLKVTLKPKKTTEETFKQRISQP